MEKISNEVISGNLGKILSIEEFEDYDGFMIMGSGASRYSNYEGYIIETATHSIKCLITNEYQCCESWGHLSSPDDFSEFIGSTILKVEQIYVESEKYDEGAEEKLNIETDIGTLQFSVYQIHNGYYGHGTVVSVEEKDKQ